MGKIEKWLVSILTAVCGACLISIITFVALQVATRYVSHLPTIWTLEASQFTFVALVFIGSIVTMSKDEDIKITLLSRRLYGAPLTSLKIFALIGVITFNTLLCLGSIKMARLNWSLPSLTIPFFNLGYLYVFSIFSTSLITLIAFIRLIYELNSLINNKESDLWK